jgi:ribosomal protein S18 acetylase RimI-like enzyme
MDPSGWTPTEPMSLPEPTIRLATTADAAALADLAARTFHDTFAADNTAADMAAHLVKNYGAAIQAAEIADPAIATLLMEHAGVPIAFAQLRSGPAPPCVVTRQPIEIWRFYLDKAFIGRGIAAVLMDRSLAEVAARGADVCWLGVWERNLRAQAFYRKYGFTVAGTQFYDVGIDRQTDYVMARPVAR